MPCEDMGGEFWAGSRHGYIDDLRRACQDCTIAVDDCQDKIIYFPKRILSRERHATVAMRVKLSRNCHSGWMSRRCGRTPTPLKTAAYTVAADCAGRPRGARVRACLACHATVSDRNRIAAQRTYGACFPAKPEKNADLGCFDGKSRCWQKAKSRKPLTCIELLYEHTQTALATD